MGCVDSTVPSFRAFVAAPSSVAFVSESSHKPRLRSQDSGGCALFWRLLVVAPTGLRTAGAAKGLGLLRAPSPRRATAMQQLVRTCSERGDELLGLEQALD